MPPPSSSSSSTDDIVIGVLCLQGAFLEHMITLRRFGVVCCEVRTCDQLMSCDGLIIPGGESTTIISVAERWGMIVPLRDYISIHERPVFGTCAGMILLSDIVGNQKIEGQQNLGGLNVKIHRNFYPHGQLGSFDGHYDVPVLHQRYGGDITSHAVFIRAPGLTDVGDDCEVLCSVPTDDIHCIGGVTNPIAVRQNNILATTFHPELTRDDRWHRLFIDMVIHYKHAHKTTQQQTNA